MPRRYLTMRMLMVTIAALIALAAVLPAAGFAQAGASIAIYGDGLAPGWSDWSWGGSVNFNATSPVYVGSQAIAYTATSAWAGFRLQAPADVDTAQYPTLTFA